MLIKLIKINLVLLQTYQVPISYHIKQLANHKQNMILQLIVNIVSINNFLILFMKQFIDIIPPTNLLKQNICLPHLKAKSLSLPSSRLINCSHRYQDKNSIDLLRDTNEQKKNQKSIFNLQQIQRKAKLDRTFKTNVVDRKKILSQYQTVDLWKQKHSIVLHLDLKKTRKQKSQRKPSKKQLLLQNNINKFRGEEENVLRLKKLKKINSYQKMQKNREVGFLPEEVVVHKIKQLKRLKKDDKLEIKLKKQGKESPIIARRTNRTSIKVAVPIAQITYRQKQKIINTIRDFEEVNEKNHPSKWETSIHYSEDEQQF